MKRKISEKKLREVEEIKNLANKYSVLGIVDMTNLPSLQLQRIRHQLRNIILLKMYKKRLIKIVLDQLKNKEDISKLNNILTGEPALIFTNDSPFKLAKLFDKEKSNAPARQGQIAPDDITIPAGPTNFTPGPIIGELGQLGIKTEVKEGKVAIKEDKLLVEEGQIINQKAAELLLKLGIEPMKVGLNLIATYEKGIIYTKDILSVDEKIYIDNLKQFGRDAFSLAISIGYISTETINYLIKKAFKDANVLADSKKILTSENIKKELAKIERETEALKNKLNIEVKESKKEEPKIEIIKEEMSNTAKKEMKKEDKKELKETKKITTEELLKEAEEETREEREKLQKERKEKEELRKAEEKLKELTDKAIKKKK